MTLRVVLFLIPVAIFSAMAGMFAAGMMRENPNALPSTAEGGPAPDLSLDRLGELGMLTDADLDAPGVKLVNFWASWCVPCRVEHPQLEKLAEEGIPIYGVNYKDEPGDALGFLEELGNPYAAVGADSDGRDAIDWGVYGVPETYVIDGEGEVVLRFTGPLTTADIEETLRPAIEEARRN